ncbi:hypothetical protein BJF89_17000 [Corynebacterium sp. CNJ-954]|uniref:IS110 family transposase n=1 Tax=Corynebacterium sp. CNJ-954 TaxID=1904962 RepID=UPI00095FE41F|nr:hypothetical protein BJF89_17000 [Corynebacterium sp. CNJ-954]
MMTSFQASPPASHLRCHLFLHQNRLDVGKTAHHGCALTTAGSRLYARALPEDEASLWAVFDELKAHDSVPLIVYQPNTIGALPVGVARSCDCAVAYLPGLAIHKAADLYPRQAKTDPRDAFIIASTARTTRATPCVQSTVSAEVFSALKMLSGLDDDTKVMDPSVLPATCPPVAQHEVERRSTNG